MPSCTGDYRASFFPRGLNDAGTVVGYAEDFGGCSEDAWVWSLCGEFGLPVASVMSLSDMVPTSYRTDANDINNAGVVAGSAVNPRSGARPFVRDLGSYVPPPGSGLAPTFEIGAIEDGIGDAFDVNDDSPSRIVGTMFQPSDGSPYAFSHELGTSPTAFVELDPFASQTFSSARGAAVSTTSGESLIAGTSWQLPAGFPLYACDDFLAWNAIRWTLIEPPPTPPLALYNRDGTREDFLIARDRQTICSGKLKRER